MPTQVQLRRGNTTDTLIFTGAAGEVTVDTDKKTIVVHDGTTSGGHNLSTEANTGAGLITVTNAYQANVGAARIADVALGQANTGAGNITVTNAYQANVGVAIASGQANTGAGNITVTNAYQANTGAVQIAKLDKAGGTITGNLTVSGITTLGNGAVLGVPASGTVTNLTGTASININGTVGATTPGTGAFTTLSSTLGANFATSSGSVGVGTASPQALLHVGAVAEAPGFGTTSQMCYVNGTSQPEVLIRETTNDVVVSMYADSTSGSIRTATNHPLVFFTNNTERARINAAGGLAVTGTLSATSFGVIGARTQFKGTNADITGATGSGVEIFGGSTPGILAYNRDGSAYLPLTINALTTAIQASSTTIGSFSSTGLAVTGTLSATGMIYKGTPNNAPSAGDDLVLQTTGYTGITLFGGAADASTVYFRNQAAPTVERGYLQYDFATSLMTSGSNTAVTGTLSATGILFTSDTTQATSTTAASLKTAGGLAVAKQAYFGDTVIMPTGTTNAFGTISLAAASVSVPNNTATTIIAMGSYSLFNGVSLIVGGDEGNISFCAFVSQNGGGAYTLSNLINKNCTLSLSGANLQLTHTLGSTTTVKANAFLFAGR